jgi:hypothetical protein
MILAAIEWQGGSARPVEEFVRALRRRGDRVETAIMRADTVILLSKALEPNSILIPGGDEPPLYLYVAAAAGNGQILFSDVAWHAGIRFADFVR